jgi:DNA-binding transcriptional MocR family regulator
LAELISGTSSADIAASVELAVLQGRLRPGDRLPTIRSLSQRLGVSTATVSAAYTRLRDRGVLIARTKSGTCVAQTPPLPITRSPSIPPGVYDLSQGTADPTLLPHLGPAIAALTPAQRLGHDDLISDDLLDLAERSFRNTGLPSHGLTVVSGAMDGIDRVLQVHCRPGDRVAVEDPGYPPVFDLLGAHGLVKEAVAVDDQGLQPDALDHALRRGATVLITCPSAQNPTGAATTPSRAADLVQVLDRWPQTLVIEDDHAGPVAGAPGPTLALECWPRWARILSVTKWLGADLRLALLAGDVTTVARVRGRLLLGAGFVSRILQELAVTLWAAPATTLLLHKAAEVYRQRRQALLDALAAHGIAGSGRSGLNVWVPVSEEGPAVQHLLTRGWAVRAGERFRINTSAAVRITTSTLATDAAGQLAADLAALTSSDRWTRAY